MGFLGDIGRERVRSNFLRCRRSGAGSRDTLVPLSHTRLIAAVATNKLGRMILTAFWCRYMVSSVFLRRPTFIVQTRFSFVQSRRSSGGRFCGGDATPAKAVMTNLKLTFVIFFLLVANSSGFAQQRRKVIIDQDCSGPGGSNMQTLLTLIQSPQVEVLGITVVSGNQWRDEEVSRTLRLLELIGRTDIPVVPGAVYPLVHRRKEAQLWQARYGRVAFAGAWDDRWWHEHDVIPRLIEGEPHTKAADEDAAHFLIRMVHKYPHEVTIYEGGPMTDLALANAIDPHFAELAEGLVFMGGSLNPQTEDPEFLSVPRHEFNFWFDPEAAKSVLEAPWKKIVCTPVDI